MKIKGLNIIALKRGLLEVAEAIQRYHVTIIIVIVLASIITAVAQVNTILSRQPDDVYRQSTQQKTLQTNFDKDTIEAINNLRQREDTSSLTLPSGRVNPFTE